VGEVGLGRPGRGATEADWREARRGAVRSELGGYRVPTVGMIGKTETRFAPAVARMVMIMASSGIVVYSLRGGPGIAS
jgi:hypothetical protein